MDQLNLTVAQNEKVLWKGHPKFWPFIIGHFIGVFIAAFIGIFFLILRGLSGSFSIFSLVGGAVGSALISAIVSRFVWSVTYYAITDKRVIFQRGIIGRDFTFVDFDKIQNATVNVGLIDKIFNTGTIQIYSGKMGTGRNGSYPIYDIIASIPNPYDTFKFFQKTEFDIKAEMEFPSKYRPDTSPGYKTKYEPEEKDKK